MANITLRSSKGSPLTHAEVDANFTNLNTDKLDTAGIALGSAASPTIKFTGDTNTGIYSPGADQVALATNGTGRLFVDSTGNVGIGTTSPGVPLETRKNQNAASQIKIANSDTSASAQAIVTIESGTVDVDVVNLTGYKSAGLFLTQGFGSLNTHIQDFSAHIFRNQGGSSEYARIDSSGRLLVGTSTNSGGALLQVNGDRIKVGTAKTPASAAATGTTGEICWDSSYIYVCTATDTWKRAALSSW